VEYDVRDVSVLQGLAKDVIVINRGLLMSCSACWCHAELAGVMLSLSKHVAAKPPSEFIEDVVPRDASTGSA
jgi:hypothetical protein